MARSISYAVVALMACAGAAQAQVWTEIPDAPALPPGQMTFGAGPLVDIVGALGGGSDVDMFCIEIFSPATFGAWTETAFAAGTLGPAFASFDSQLWLFRADGTGVLFNDDSAVPGSFLSGIGPAVPVPLGGPAPVLTPGTYFLAISEYDDDALGPGGLPIWLDAPFTTQRAPDGPGAPGPVLGWTASGNLGGDYHIVLSGATFCPSPGSVALLGFAGLVASRRRR